MSRRGRATGTQPGARKWAGAAEACGAVALGLLPLSGNAYYMRLVTTMGMYTALGMGLNVLVGQAGLLDMGYVGFFAVGAYARALLASPQLGIHLPFAVTLGVAVSAGLILSLVVGLPTLRLRGDYLAIVTMGFSEVIRILLLNLDRPINITNGPNGIIRVDPISIAGFSFDTPESNYYLMLAFAAAAYFVYQRLDRSAAGLRWRAVRDDHIAAASLGVDVAKYRILAFAVGSVFATTSGVLFASWQGAVFPQNFTLGELITLYCMVVLGGAGNPSGTLVGVAALTVLPELLRGYSVYRMLIYGAALVALMSLRPGGLFPPNRRTAARAGLAGTVSPVGRATRHEGSSDGRASPVLEVRGLCRSFGGLRALSDLSLEVRSGEILSVIGPNGAGKTTLLNILSGVTRPSSGDCFIRGQKTTGLPPHAVYRRGLSRTFQNLRLFDSMTVAENILVSGHKMPALGGPLERSLGEVASGLDYARRKELEIARAVAGDPDILLLDEPAAGMGAVEKERLAGQIRALKEGGKSIVLIEHQMDLVMQVSDRVIVMDGGRKIAEGTPSSVADNPLVRQVYLGTGGADPNGSSAKAASPKGEPLLELSGVGASYGPVQAIRDLNLRVWEGEAVCLLGANGAGKSTTLKTIIGGLGLACGTIRFNGSNVMAAAKRTAGIGIVPEGRRVFSGMTVEENLLVGASDRNHEGVGGSLKDAYTLFPRLLERRGQPAGTLSGGEQQMLAVARALMSKPRLLLLDEPSMGLAPVAADAVFAALARLRADGMTMLLVEQNAGRALALCDRGYVLTDGRIVAEGTSGQLSTGSDLQNAYLAADLVDKHS